jgi:hypothetical protein
MAGRPHWFFHHMGLGEPIGYSARITMNNLNLYRNQSNGLPRAVYIALMGDPTLRLDPVFPVADLRGAAGPDGVHLSWTASADAVAGYHVYRSLAPGGPFTRLTSSLINPTEFVDAEINSSVYTYMVRAIKLQLTPSGSYYNPSQGRFVTLATSPIRLAVSMTPNSASLSWNSVPLARYQVQWTADITRGNWADAGGVIVASGDTTGWTDGDIANNPRRFYRVVQLP